MRKSEVQFIHTTSRNGMPKVVALKEYHGKMVSAVAKCSPNDIPSIKDGEALAALRLEQKILKKRLASAKRHQAEREKYIDYLMSMFEKMDHRYICGENNIKEILAAQKANEAALAELLDRLAGERGRIVATP